MSFQMKVHSKRLQFARELKVTTKYGAKCRIHARIRKKIKNTTFFSKAGETLNSVKKIELD